MCRIAADVRGARAAAINGIDGATSITIDGNAYWFFGDTVRAGPGARQDVIAASVATTADADASDCLDLDFKSSGGAAEPLFPKGDETTAWPDGVVRMDDGSIVFYMVKAYRQSPFRWNVGAVGLGRVPAGSLDGERVVETLWDENSGFAHRVSGASSPVRVGDDVYVYIRTDAGEIFVARAGVNRLAEIDAYTYWDGAAWRASPAEAQPMLPPGDGYLPSDNGVFVYRDEALEKWIALYNAHLARVSVRTADAPQGPWSQPLDWLHCRPLVEDVYPYCYSAVLHPELNAGDGRFYITFSSQRPYDVTLMELRAGVAIREWRGASGDLRYAAVAPGDGYIDHGVAFYASIVPAPGLVPVYEHVSDVPSYSLDQPDDAGLVFYAHPSAGDGVVPLAPVYEWRQGDARALDARPRAGWQRGDALFYAPCAGIEPMPEGCES